MSCCKPAMSLGGGSGSDGGGGSEGGSGSEGGGGSEGGVIGALVNSC